MNALVDISPLEVLRRAKLDKLSKVKLLNETEKRVTVKLWDIEGLDGSFNISIAKVDAKNHWILASLGIEPLYKGKANNR
jgi:uncharacterized protein YlxP (DUF503 family)